MGRQKNLSAKEKYERQKELARNRQRRRIERMTDDEKEAKKRYDRERMAKLRDENKIKRIKDMTPKEKRKMRKYWRERNRIRTLKKQSVENVEALAKLCLEKERRNIRIFKNNLPGDDRDYGFLRRKSSHQLRMCQARNSQKYLRKEQESNPVACILGTDTQIKQVALVRNNVPPRSKSITVSLHSKPPPPPPLTPAPASTIKVVDLKKLLPPQPQPHPTEAVKRSADSQVPVTSVSSVLNSLVSKSTFNKPTSHTAFVNRTCVTASQVLTCLRVILPRKFDLSRMIPNEKVASLVIRYLKLDEKNEEIQNVVKEHLRIIIEAVKMKDKRSLDFTKHPYTKITDRDLKHALTFIIPENFSIIDINNELLGLICVTLNLDIYTDAYFILIRKICKFSSEGQKLSEVLNRSSKVYGTIDVSLELEKDVEVNEVAGNVTMSQIDLTINEPTLTNSENSSISEIEYIDEQRRELEFVDVNDSTEKSQEPVDLEPSTKGFFNYFNLCHHVQMSPRNSNMQDEGSKLHHIINNNINVNNVQDNFQILRAKQFPEHSCQLKCNKSPNSVKNKSDEKLKMKPVVVIQNLLDYKSDQLLFMKSEEVESNGSYKQIPFSLKQSSSNQNYSAEQVRKLTDVSYKQFRRIVLKRDGTKAVFQVKYAKLKPGTVVFAKNFRHPGVGWVKGVVSKPEGPLKYQVKLDNNSMWCCTVDQLRPLLKNVVNSAESQRGHRPIEPKQLFDL